MFAKKLPTLKAKKQQAIDVLLSKLNNLPPGIDLAVALATGSYAMYATYVSQQSFAGILGTIAALCFAFLAVNATLREMRWLKFLSAHASEESLKRLNRQEFEFYLSILFRLGGYSVRSGVTELHRQDDADWIITKKKEVILVQFNHFDEDAVGVQSLQSLQKAASIFQASGAIAITLGYFYSDAIQWGARKGLKLMTVSDLLAMAAEFTGEVSESATAQEQSLAAVVPAPHPSACLIFVDFASLSSCLNGFADLVSQFPLAQLVASTLPQETSVDMLYSSTGLSVSGAAEPHASGRYFSIQRYLDSQPDGKRTPWVALDSEPRQVPAGCSELVAVNPSFGFNASVRDRLQESLGLSMRRMTA